MNWAQWNEKTYQDDMAAWRAKHGVAVTVPTGPATAQEMEVARAAMGKPVTHDGWLAACADRAANREFYEGCDD